MADVTKDNSEQSDKKKTIVLLFEKCGYEVKDLTEIGTIVMRQ